jgi:hypothetical protein
MIGERLHLRGVAAPPVVLPLRPGRRAPAAAGPAERRDRRDRAGALPTRAVGLGRRLPSSTSSSPRGGTARRSPTSPRSRPAATPRRSSPRRSSGAGRRGDALVLLIEMDERRSWAFTPAPGWRPSSRSSPTSSRSGRFRHRTPVSPPLRASRPGAA